MLGTLLAVALLVVGAALLTAGAEAFVRHISPAASRLGVTVLALGILLAGAEPEEAVIAMLASDEGHPALAAGDVIGTNLVILTVTVGLAALLTPLPVSRRVMQYAAAAAATGALAVALIRAAPDPPDGPSYRLPAAAGRPAPGRRLPRLGRLAVHL